MVKTWCVGGRHYSDTINQNIYKKLKPKIKKLVKLIKGKCDICGRKKSRFLTK